MCWFPSGSMEKKPRKEEAQRIDSAARFVKWWGADVVMFQEMRDAATCSNLVARPALAGFKVNVCSQYAPSYRRAPSWQQDAIISRYDAVDAGFLEFERRRRPAAPPRGMTWAVLDIDGHLHAFVTVHLKSNRSSNWGGPTEEERQANTAKREEAARQLTAFVKQNLEGKSYKGRRIENVWIGGDFNTSTFDTAFAGEQTIHTITAAGYRDVFAGVPESDRATIPQTRNHAAGVFDWLFVKGPAKLSTPSVAPKQPTSDHLLISVFLMP